MVRREVRHESEAQPTGGTAPNRRDRSPARTVQTIRAATNKATKTGASFPKHGVHAVRRVRERFLRRPLKGPHSGPYGELSLRRSVASSHCRSPASSLRRSVAPSLSSAFTLVEMIVVMTIIVLILLLALPAARRLWEDRKAADAENAIAGALSVARSKALKATEGEVGLFFYVDDAGVQRVAPMAHAVVEAADIPAGVDEDAYRLAFTNVFKVQAEKSWALYPPLRVVPRYVVDAKTGDLDDYDVFDEDGTELANNDLAATPPTTVNQAQRHRNFFTMVFDPQGRLVVQRDVVIQDEDKDCNQRGDLTGLLVSKDCKPTDPADVKATVKNYFLRESTVNATQDLDTVSTPPGAIAVPFLVVGSDKSGMTALNFPSVDGLLVYDDSSLASFEAKDKRRYLLSSGQPLYANRMTGALIRGPLGESVSSVKP